MKRHHLVGIGVLLVASVLGAGLSTVFKFPSQIVLGVGVTGFLLLVMAILIGNRRESR